MQSVHPQRRTHLSYTHPHEYQPCKGSRSVEKALTIPAWLNDRARAEGINFSKTLHDALIEKIRYREYDETIEGKFLNHIPKEEVMQ